MGRFFTVSSLPSLEFGSKPDISSEQLFALFEINLTKREKEKIGILRLWIDLSNIHQHFYKKEPDQRGLLSKSLLEELIEMEYGLPEYVFEFFFLFETEILRKQNFPWLMAKYFEEEGKRCKGAMKEFIRFEHEWRVLLTAYRAKRIGRDIQRELRFEDEANPIVRGALLQGEGAGKFIFPHEYQELERELHTAGPNPLKQSEVMAKYRYDFYTEYSHKHPFGGAALAAYMMRLWVLEEYFSLHQEEGEKILNNLMERE